MQFVSCSGEQGFIEGPRGEPLMGRVDDVNLVIGECFSYGSQQALLYAENLTDNFFDLSSREAGEILQKLRNYRIQLAVVRDLSLPLTHYFQELLKDELSGSDFRLFGSYDDAKNWLCSF